jgi:hypothetical protein
MFITDVLLVIIKISAIGILIAWLAIRQLPLNMSDKFTCTFMEVFTRIFLDYPVSRNIVLIVVQIAKSPP